MPELEELNLIKSFLAEHDDRPDCEQERAWCDFYLAYEPVIWAIVRKHHRLSSDVEEVVQEVWATLVRGLRGLHYDPSRGSLRNWVVAVARHVAVREARERSRPHTEALTPERAELLVDPAPGPAILFGQKVEQDQVRAILAELRTTLPDQTYHIVVQHWLEGRTVREIAAESGLSEHQVWLRLSRALHKVRALVRRDGREAG
jgi:RNA polymerase sigma-70 factor (ECF subfamily)